MIKTRKRGKAKKAATEKGWESLDVARMISLSKAGKKTKKKTTEKVGLKITRRKHWRCDVKELLCD